MVRAKGSVCSCHFPSGFWTIISAYGWHGNLVIPRLGADLGRGPHAVSMPQIECWRVCFDEHGQRMRRA